MAYLGDNSEVERNYFRIHHNFESGALLINGDDSDWSHPS